MADMVAALATTPAPAATKAREEQGGKAGAVVVLWAGGAAMVLSGQGVAVVLWARGVVIGGLAAGGALVVPQLL